MVHKRSGGGLSTAQQAAKFLGVSVLAGVVLAGIALPATGALGLSAKGTAAGFDHLPGELEQPPLSQASRILDANGGLIATVYSRDRTVVPITKMSPNILQAIVDIEDARYYEHGALDVKGILRAMSNNASTGDTQGASTLTQQYVKNVFVEEAGDDATKVAQATQQTVGRKIKEMKYAIQVEKELGKKKILENYLNITFFGEQAYGIEAASERYFSRHAADLTLDQAALLAGLVQSPSRYDPISDEQEALQRRNTVLARMAQLKDITAAQAATAEKAPLGLKVSAPKSGCITAVNGAGFFCDYVEHTFLENAAFGKTKDERAKLWNTGGLTITTTLDPKSQRSLLKGINKHVYKTDDIAAAMTMVQPGTGKVLAMGQSKPYGSGKNETEINYSVDADMGGGGGFANGSTFKPITAAAALEAGFKPTQQYPAPYKLPYPTVTTCGGTVIPPNGQGTQNEMTSEVGPFRMPEALKRSINTYFVALEQNVGLCPILNMAAKLGVTRADGTALKPVASLTLGTNELSPLTVSAAYAAFANRGVYCTPVVINSVTNSAGKHLTVPKSLCSRAMSTDTADTLNTMLEGVVDDGTGTAANLEGRPTAGKTGTTDDRKDAWFAGYTPNVAAAVWMGDPNGAGKNGTRLHMSDITIGPRHYGKVEGATGPAPIWKDAVSGALKGKPVLDFITVPLNIPDKAQENQTPPPTNPADPNSPAPPGGTATPGDDGKHRHSLGGATNGGVTTMGTTTGVIGGVAGGTGGGTTGGTTTGGTTQGTGGGPGGPSIPPILLPSGGSNAGVGP
ncbi:Membrane carboxypeptidase (penicillin-binding protein) [Streptomyces sp. DvalAA-14]|uniref:transglycosylase domain-containing protein n=1 Tax=unclassified Streptomyces TaxID=2593676 RepID=UPI00081B2EF8|nr:MULTISPECIES: transglycosylase domain-containing protein [unclassified Streptomyces]MYS22531.1 penicillin-binding protein [Streptomyces sp. SID4948]SCE17772.1 Membrane carboxypeptidase (penicillin-binding protein) [Streptomyces sp. DvalAA-14]